MPAVLAIVDDEPFTDTPTRACAVCGNPLPPAVDGRSKRRRYCSGMCRTATVRALRAIRTGRPTLSPMDRVTALRTNSGALTSERNRAAARARWQRHTDPDQRRAEAQMRAGVRWQKESLMDTEMNVSRIKADRLEAEISMLRRALDLYRALGTTTARIQAEITEARLVQLRGLRPAPKIIYGDPTTKASADRFKRKVARQEQYARQRQAREARRAQVLK